MNKIGAYVGFKENSSYCFETFVRCIDNRAWPLNYKLSNIRKCPSNASSLYKQSTRTCVHNTKTFVELIAEVSNKKKKKKKKKKKTLTLK